MNFVFLFSLLFLDMYTHQIYHPKNSERKGKVDAIIQSLKIGFGIVATNFRKSYRAPTKEGWTNRQRISWWEKNSNIQPFFVVVVVRSVSIATVQTLICGCYLCLFLWNLICWLIQVLLFFSQLWLAKKYTLSYFCVHEIYWISK